MALNKLHTSTEAEIEAIVGPPLCVTPCNRHLDSSSVAQFPVPLKRDKGEQASDRPKVTLHHVQPFAAWHGDNEAEGEEATAPRNRSGLCWRRGNRDHTPKGAVFVHTGGGRRAPEAPDCVWNNSCLINQRAKQQDYSDQEWRGRRTTASTHSLHHHHQQQQQQQWRWWQWWWLRKRWRLCWGVDAALINNGRHHCVKSSLF